MFATEIWHNSCIWKLVRMRMRNIEAFVALTNLALIQHPASLCPAGQAIPMYANYVSMIIIKPRLRCGEKNT